MNAPPMPPLPNNNNNLPYPSNNHSHPSVNVGYPPYNPAYPTGNQHYPPSTSHAAFPSVNQNIHTTQPTANNTIVIQQQALTSGNESLVHNFHNSMLTCFFPQNSRANDDVLSKL